MKEEQIRSWRRFSRQQPTKLDCKDPVNLLELQSILQGVQVTGEVNKVEVHVIETCIDPCENESGHDSLCEKRCWRVG